jgi:hypothetical protein
MKRRSIVTNETELSPADVKPTETRERTKQIWLDIQAQIAGSAAAKVINFF